MKLLRVLVLFFVSVSLFSCGGSGNGFAPSLDLSSAAPSTPPTPPSNPSNPNVNFALSSSTVSEGGGTAGIVVSLTAASSSDVTVSFSASGTAQSSSDYTIASTSLLIPAGQTQGTITVNIVDDTLYEGSTNETVILHIDSATNANLGTTLTHTLGIIENDAPPVVTISSPASGATYNEGTQVTYTISLNKASGVSTSVNYATSDGTGALAGAVGGAAAGTDYTAKSGTLVIPAGSTSGNVVVSTTLVNSYRGDRDFVFTISSPVEATLGATTSVPVMIWEITDPAPFTIASLSNQTPGLIQSANISLTGFHGTLSANVSTISTSPSSLPTGVTPAVAAGIKVNTVAQALPASVVAGDTLNVTMDLTNAVYLNSHQTNLTIGNSVFSFTARTACPTKFIEVPALSGYTSNAFCISYLEARQGAGNTADFSNAVTAPWDNSFATAATYSQSISACNAINSAAPHTSRFTIPSNNQWQSVARDIETVGSNWSSGTAGSGSLYIGHVDSSPNGPRGYAVASPVVGVNDYNNTGNNAGQAWGSGKEERRYHTLSNGNVIWDFGGNVTEWVSDILPNVFTAGAKAGSPATDLCTAMTDDTGTNGALFNITPSAGATITYGGLTSGARTLFGPVTVAGSCAAASGFGRVDYSNTLTTSLTMTRGGRYSSNTTNGGIFEALFRYDGATTGNSRIGFRCVYNP